MGGLYKYGLGPVVSHSEIESGKAYELQGLLITSIIQKKNKS